VDLGGVRPGRPAEGLPEGPLDGLPVPLGLLGRAAGLLGLSSPPGLVPDLFAEPGLLFPLDLGPHGLFVLTLQFPEELIPASRRDRSSFVSRSTRAASSCSHRRPCSSRARRREASMTKNVTAAPPARARTERTAASMRGLLRSVGPGHDHECGRCPAVRAG